MRKIIYGFIVLGMLICSANAAVAGLSVGIGIGLPNVSIGINLPVYPEMVPVPGYPVYYAPGFAGNYFFYDGMYWVYQNDNWYASSWYNGPWGYVDAMSVPLYVLRVPVGYYRQPPAYFRGWASNEPPRWGDHWGRSWEQRRGGWDHWNRAAAPRPAPLPAYQRQYAGDRYPRVEQQRALRTRNYQYQPRDKVVSQHFKQTGPKAPAARRGNKESPQQQGAQHPAPNQQGAQAGQRQQPQHREAQKGAPAAGQQHAPAAREQRQQPAAAQRQQPQRAQQQQPQRAQQQQQPQQQRAQGHEQRGGEQEHGPGDGHGR